MLYPNFLQVGDIIGISAPSDGFVEQKEQSRLNNAKNKLKENGFKIIATDNVNNSICGRSSPALTRAKELKKLYLDNNIKTIICAKGGDFSVEILPYLDFKTIKNNLKWIQGYSDITSLLYLITTKLDISTIHANNIGSFAMNPWHDSISNNLEILKGNLLEQKSFDRYQQHPFKYVSGTESYDLDTPVLWENLNCEGLISIKGRIIGGCLDVLMNIIGTKYDYTKKFIQKYKSDGIIWYFDNCELTNEQIVRSLWQLKESGWFKHCKGIVFGRSGIDISSYEVKFKDAIKTSLGELNLPIIINTDIGHKPPQLSIINGSIATISCKNGKGKIKFELI